MNLIYEEKGIGDICEVAKSKYCWHQFQGYLHRHGRHWYRARPELLSSFKQTLKGCNECHRLVDANSKEREKLFIELRGEE